MSFSPSDSQIFAPLFGHAEMTKVFSDEQFVRYMLQVEVALARVQASLNLIPAFAAEHIATAAEALAPNLAELQASTEKVGFPVIGLVNQLRAHVDEEVAGYIHWGTTTQDIMDTALVLQIRAALALLESQLEALIANLCRMAKRYQGCLMSGRTHSQQALPITFGLKVAGWLAPLLRHRQRLAEMKARLLLVQFGGAAGTLAALGPAALSVQARLAAELKLVNPPLPWHTQRDNLAELAGWLSNLSGSLGKMGQDVILLAQSEVGEVRESTDGTRGHSSTMPQKSNPVLSEIIVAAARANASLLSAVHHALIQEHERGTHGWQLEWITLPQMFSLAATAVKNALSLSEELVVDDRRMQQNIDNAQGLILAEAIRLALAPDHMSPTEASRLVRESCHMVTEQQRHLVDIIREKIGDKVNITSHQWEALKDARGYLGASEALVDRMLHIAQGSLVSK